ncbi:MAG TPA: hypothetical protein VF668_04790 [Pyrinomonadaceae bacterium]|jgi:hypothetical protein
MTTTEKIVTKFPGQPFVLNSTESVIPVNVAPKGSDAHWLFIKLRRPKREELLERETAATTVIKPKGGGESLILTNDWEPNVALGRKVAVEVKGLDGGDTFIPAKQAGLLPGWLDKAIKGYYAQAARLLWDVSMLRTDSDQKTLLNVRHEFGTDEVPDYVIFWQFTKPDEVTQADYRLNSQKISTGGGGRRASSKFITDLAVAERTFDEIFAGVEGGVIAVPDESTDGGVKLITYTAERREEFLAAVDPNVKRAAVEPVMEWLEGQLSD